MKNVILSILVAALVAAVCQAFAPAMHSTRATTSLNAFEGKKLDISTNAYARGGKPSWVFEADTMYVDEPKKADPKKAAAKKEVKKEAKPFQGFAPSTWKFN